MDFAHHPSGCPRRCRILRFAPFTKHNLQVQSINYQYSNTPFRHIVCSKNGNFSVPMPWLLMLSRDQEIFLINLIHRYIFEFPWSCRSNLPDGGKPITLRICRFSTQPELYKTFGGFLRIVVPSRGAAIQLNPTKPTRKCRTAKSNRADPAAGSIPGLSATSLGAAIDRHAKLDGFTPG
jgi:hypothetical protein